MKAHFSLCSLSCPRRKFLRAQLNFVLSLVSQALYSCISHPFLNYSRLYFLSHLDISWSSRCYLERNANELRNSEIRFRMTISLLSHTEAALNDRKILNSLLWSQSHTQYSSLLRFTHLQPSRKQRNIRLFSWQFGFLFFCFYRRILRQNFQSCRSSYGREDLVEPMKFLSLQSVSWLISLSTWLFLPSSTHRMSTSSTLLCWQW